MEAKVHQLDYTLERITLSLKDIMVFTVSHSSVIVWGNILRFLQTIIYLLSHLFQPNPLSEALESVIGERTSLDGTMAVAQADAEVLVILNFFAR